MLRSYNVTSAGISAAEDRGRRIRIYFIMMAIRMACVASLFWVRGWWIILVALGGVLLPYLAVIIANEPDHRAKKDVESPEPLAITDAFEELTPHRLIVVDESNFDQTEDENKSGANKTADFTHHGSKTYQEPKSDTQEKQS
ncbi:MAG TPA: DUF3099 domain-containing protein [Microbacteriaceae bacterium]|nr:DUF3099 domain-containing protein [Microbacteriaceae bacterium]